MSQFPNDATAQAMAEAGLVPGQSPAALRLPDPARLFVKRAERLRALAAGHSLGDWLSFVAVLADAQGALVGEGSGVAPEERWQDDLRALLTRLEGTVPASARPALDALRGMAVSDCAALADRLTGGTLTADDLAAAPFVAAALQLAWTRHAAGLTASAIAVSATATACPVCGGEPVAGVIHVGMESGGLRYLHCGLCHTAWHHVRASCVACGENRHLGHRFIEGTETGVRAEVCDSCHSYLKLILAEKAPGFDPVADDLATLALDILVGESGYARIGSNPLLALAA